MKAKMLTKKAFSLAFSLMMILLICCFSFSAFAAEAECGHPNLKEDKWVVTIEPTCSMSGSKEQFCNDCNKTVTYLIDPAPNVHTIGAWEVLTPHSCTQTGVNVRRCIDCKKIIERENVPAHDYAALYGYEATCMRAGYQIKMCTTCYDIITENLPIDKDAHRYSDWYVTTEATCVNDSGVKTRKCLEYDESGNYCQHTEVIAYTEPNNHKNVTWREDEIKAPTCYEDGYTPGTCNYCEAELRDVLPKHSYSAYRILSTVPATCHSEGTERRLCECGLEYDAVLEITEDSPHVYGEWRIAKEADCQDGLRVKSCIYHPSERVEQKIPKTGEHIYGDWEVIVEPDCTTTGIRVKSCTVEGCDEKITESLPTYHVYATWTTTVEMSCADGNIKTGSRTAKCNFCNYTKNFTVPAVHNFNEWTIKEKADCKTGNPGTMQRKCSNCGKIEIKTYDEEHNFTVWVVTTAAVCADEANGISGRTGQAKRWCLTCRTEEVKTLPAEHYVDEWALVEYPDCTDTGKQTGTCRFCGKVCEEEIDSLGHNYGEWKTTVEPGCSTEGKKERTCIACNATQSEILPAEHIYSNWDLEGDSEHNSGKTNVYLNRYCTECGVTDTMKTPVTLTADYHPNLRTNEIKATCTTSGYKVDYCPDCNYSKVHSIVPAKGHELSENWYDMVEPSCTSKGSRYKTCANCDYLELVELDSLKHLLVTITPGVEPTCTQGGYTTESYCSVCKQVFPSVELPIKKHEFVNGACINCRVYEGTDDDGFGGCVCSCHSTDGFDAIIFGIIRKIYQFFGINQVCACGELHYEEAGFFAKLFGNA